MNGLYPMGLGMPSPQELLPIIVILILFFGAKRLPELARSIGQSITEFKRGRHDALDEPGADTDTDATSKAPPKESKKEA